eukprot:3446702-Rhodomonas_salina.1
MEVLGKSEVLLVPLRLNVNATQTIEDLIARRKLQHLRMVQSFLEEAHQLLVDSRPETEAGRSPHDAGELDCSLTRLFRDGEERRLPLLLRRRGRGVGNAKK